MKTKNQKHEFTIGHSCELVLYRPCLPAINILYWRAHLYSPSTGHIPDCLSSLCKDSPPLYPLVPNPWASALGSWGLLILQGTAQIHTGKPRATLFLKPLPLPIGCHQLLHQHLLGLPEMLGSSHIYDLDVWWCERYQCPIWLSGRWLWLTLLSVSGRVRIGCRMNVFFLNTRKAQISPLPPFSFLKL